MGERIISGKSHDQSHGANVPIYFNDFQYSTAFP